MDKSRKEFPPEIKARWDALALEDKSSEETERKPIPAEELKAFETYLFGKAAAKPEQVTAFVELMKKIPANENDLFDHLFDELHKKFHQTKGARESVHAITKSLLEARHREAMTFLAQNHLGMENPKIPQLVDKTFEEACKEVLKKPREHMRQTDHLRKSILRRRLLHVADVLRVDSKEHILGAVPTILVKEPGQDVGTHVMQPIEKIEPHHVLKHANPPGAPREVQPIVKKVAHHVLPNGKLLGKPHMNGTDHAANGTPVQTELFNEKHDLIAIKARAANIRPITFQPRDGSSPNPNTLPSFRLKIRGGRSYYEADTSGIEKRLANPVPITEEEIALSERRRVKAEKKAAFIEAGGFAGMLGLSRRKNGSAANAAFLKAVQQELFDGENNIPVQATNGSDASVVTDQQTPQASKNNPIPVTDKEKEKAKRQRDEAERKAAYEAGGGFMGMVGRRIREATGFAEQLKVERTQEPNIGGDDMVRGK